MLDEKNQSSSEQQQQKASSPVSTSHPVSSSPQESRSSLLLTSEAEASHLSQCEECDSLIPRIDQRKNSNTNTSQSPSIALVEVVEGARICEPSSANNTKSPERESSFMELQAVHPVIKSFLVGSISGTCSTVLFQPLDLLKTRLQAVQPHHHQHAALPLGITTARGSGGGTSMFTILSQIVRTENLGSLWRGMTPSLTRCVPGVGLYFATIHGLKRSFAIEGEPTALQSVLLGVTGRTFSGVMMIPFTVIKTRFESKVYQYSSIRGALDCIYRQEGVRGLTCGLIPTLLRDAPFSGLYLMMYTSSKKAVGKDWMESPTLGPYVRFSCGIVAGIGASLVTQPFDVVKTKMQLYPDKFTSVRIAVPFIFEKYGIEGYFKGLMPRMIRRTLIAAMSWTVYEQLVQSIGLK